VRVGVNDSYAFIVK